MSTNNYVKNSEAKLNKKLNNSITKTDIEYIKKRLDEIYDIVSNKKNKNTSTGSTNLLGGIFGKQPESQPANSSKQNNLKKNNSKQNNSKQNKSAETSNKPVETTGIFGGIF